MENRSELNISGDEVNFISKSEYAYRTLRDAILSGLLEPGRVLNQAELAERFHMSRMPIRDAIKLLDREGLVRMVLHKGATVTHFSIQELRDIYAIRKILEGYALREATPNINGALFSRLEQINRGIARLGKKGQVEAMIKENELFHLLLYEPCGNRKLVEIIQNLWSSYPKRFFWIVPGRGDRVVMEHQDILNAVRARDADRAERLIREHLVLSQEALDYIASLREGGAAEQGRG